MVGGAAASGLVGAIVNDTNGTFIARFVTEGSGKVRIGSQADGISPTVGAASSTNVTSTGADLSGSVTATNGNPITARGFVYSPTATNSAPTIGGTGATQVGLGGTTGTMSTTLSGLSGATAYSFRGYATNSAGTSYGAVSAFDTLAPPTPTISIGDATLAEGNAGSASMTFTVTLSAISASTVTVSASTSNGSAIAGSDYTATGPTLITFNSGVTSQTFAVPVTGDASSESSETFFVTLTSPTNGTIVDGVATGTIVNDDAAPPSRVFVSNSGSDVAMCSDQTTPCRNLAAAIDQVAIDGEVIVLTPGEYAVAPLVITKGVKVTSPTGTVAFLRDPITVNAPGGSVVLRGLTLKGAGTGDGITLTAATSLSIEETVIDRWSNGLKLGIASGSPVTVSNSIFRASSTGIQASVGATNAVSIEGVRFEGNGGGIDAVGGSYFLRESAFASNSVGISAAQCVFDVQRSEFVLNGTAVTSLGGGGLRISRSVLFGNNVGLSTTGGGVILSAGTNIIRGNGTNTAGTIGTVPEQ